MTLNFLNLTLILTLSTILVAALYPSIFKNFLSNRKFLVIIVFFIGVLIVSAFYVAGFAIAEDIPAAGKIIYSDIFQPILSFFYLKKFAILFKIGLFCTWLSIGIYLYLKVLPNFPLVKNYFEKLGILRLTLGCFSVIFAIKMVLWFISDLILLREAAASWNIDHNYMAADAADSSYDNSNTNSNNSNSNKGSTSSNNSNTNTSNTNNTSKTNSVSSTSAKWQPSLTDNKLNEVALDSFLMGNAISAGAKVAQTLPGTAGKVGVLAGSLAVGAGAIIGRKVATKIYPGTDTTKFIDDIINQYFNFTGNLGIDFLLIIQFLEKVDLYLIFLISYNLLLLVIDVDKLEVFLAKILPVKVVNYSIRIIRLLIASVKVNVTLLLVLLIISHFLTYSYLSFYIENIFDIAERFFKK